LVAKGFTQILGVDYGDTFVPIAGLDRVRVLLSIATQNMWKVYQMDIVNSTFLNGILEELYVDKPSGYVIK
jgi:hypothetical protein